MPRLNLQTSLCQTFGIQYPVLLAGMADASGPTLTAAVSNAGGLGILGATFLTPEQIRDWIRKTRTLTSKPFGVDVVFPSGIPVAGETADLTQQVPQRNLEYVAQLQQRLGVQGAKHLKWEWGLSEAYTRRQMEVVLEEGAPVFASGLGTPEWVIREAKLHGMTTLSLVGTCRAARRMVAQGVDVVVAQGYEGGGHTGKVGALTLIPQVVDAVHPTPVVAAGGIFDGRGLVAALALGAVGVWLGTAFLATPEAGVDFIDVGYTNQASLDIWKQAVIRASESDTEVTRLYTGKTARYLKNKLIDVWEREGTGYLPMPFQALLINPLISSLRESSLHEYQSGFAGQAAGAIREIKPAGQVVAEIVDQAHRILQEQ